MLISRLYFKICHSAIYIISVNSHIAVKYLNKNYLIPYTLTNNTILLITLYYIYTINTILYL